MSWTLILRDLSQGAVQATVEDLKRFASDEVVPVVRQTRQRVNDLLNKLNLGAIDFGTVKIRFSATAPPTAADANGSIAFTPSGIYSRQAGAWVLVGGATAASITQAQVTLPYAKRDHKVTVVDAAVSPTSKILVSLAGVAETKANASDAIDLTALLALPGTGTFELQASFLTPFGGPLTVNYMVG